MKSRLHNLLVVGLIASAMSLASGDTGSQLQAQIAAQPGTTNYENAVIKEENARTAQIHMYRQKSQDYLARARVETDEDKRQLYANRAQRYQDALEDMKTN